MRETNEYAIEWVIGDEKATCTVPENTAMNNKLIRLAEEYPQDVEIINQSIMNGWTGLFPLKSDNKNPVTDKLNESYDLINQWVHEREVQE